MVFTSRIPPQGSSQKQASYTLRLPSLWCLVQHHHSPVVVSYQLSPVSSGIIASWSPILAALIVDKYGLSSVFYYNAALVAAAAAVLFLAPLKRPAHAPTRVKAPVG